MSPSLVISVALRPVFFMDFAQRGFRRLLSGRPRCLWAGDNVFTVLGLAFASGLNHGHPPLVFACTAKPARRRKILAASCSREYRPPDHGK